MHDARIACIYCMAHVSGKTQRLRTVATPNPTKYLLQSDATNARLKSLWKTLLWISIARMGTRTAVRHVIRSIETLIKTGYVNIARSGMLRTEMRKRYACMKATCADV